MLLYNVTITVDIDVHEEWARWVRQSHIPDVMATGMFVSYRMSRLMGHEHTDAEIYTMQYLVKDMAYLRRYQEEFAPELQRQHKERYDGKFAAFRTVMDRLVPRLVQLERMIKPRYWPFWRRQGDRVIVAPGGKVVAGPLHDQFGILAAEIDLDRPYHKPTPGK